ncbi:SRL [Cordylochernes scorpioides]|uniref:SRL n=1 Tax=Cordylochernes scorpioides TaxID=51811 RepID=A0ABY6L2K0_9ARAC|nr:SRL [Cordylochernes scorpioides]
MVCCLVTCVDAEIFAKPMVLFIGPWSAGKSSIINYLLGVERTGQALKTGDWRLLCEVPSGVSAGVEPTDTQFTVITHGEDHTKVSGTEMASDWAYSSVQKFGQNFLNHFRGIKMASPLLQKIVLVDTPGIIENRKMYERGYPVNDAFQWFIDRADAIYVVFDPAKMEIGNELESLLDQLKGRESQVRFVLNKADTIRKSDLMRVIGQLFWNLSPLLGSSEAPVIYAVSLMTKPFHPGAPTKFLLDQELMFLADLRDTVDKRVENRILFARRHAVRVRNHAKLVDCYLNTYYRHKSIFSSKKKIAEQITEHPGDYSIYEGISTLTNVSRYDLPDPGIYRDFFRLNPLYDFRPLTSTCSYFRGCPLDKLDNAISYDIMQILGQYKKKCKALSGDKDESR